MYICIMEKKINTKKIIKSVFKTDPDSDRFRICPECNAPHMVKHRSQDFCNNKCCNEYNNRKKRLQKQSEENLHTVKEKSPRLGDPLFQQGVTANSLLLETQKAEIISDHGSAGMDINLEILDGLKIDPKEGTHFYIQDLLQLGFDFSIHSERPALHNISAPHQCHFLIFGKYRFYSIDHGKILIVKQF